MNPKTKGSREAAQTKAPPMDALTEEQVTAELREQLADMGEDIMPLQVLQGQQALKAEAREQKAARLIAKGTPQALVN